jgi:hypothetical protein
MARRSFLRACGGSAALLLPLLRDIEARADGAGAPLRFLIIHKPLGVQWPLWRPAGDGDHRRLHPAVRAARRSNRCGPRW